MIDLNDLKSRSALSILEGYSGKNPYLNKLKKEYLKNRKVKFTEKQIKYIIDFNDKEPILINKVVNITSYLGEELKKQNDLSFVPERILIEYMLADTEKSFHIYGKLKKNQKESKMYWLPKTQVLDDPYFEDIDIDVDFDKYVKIDKLNRKPFEHQKEGIKFLLSRNGCILADDMGLGKRIANDVPVLTPNGWVNHGDLKVGDFVIGSNGKPTKVLQTYPSESDKYYKITFTDGTIVEACEEHLWAVSEKSSDSLITLTIKEMLDQNGVKKIKGNENNSNKEYLLKTYYKEKNGDCKWFIPMVKPVEFNNRKVKLDPYLLGVLLSNGHISHDKISLNNIDKQLIKEINKRLPHNIELSDNKQTKEVDFKLIDINGTNTLKEYLDYYNLLSYKSDSKFIPEDYKYNSIKIRLEVLQGLMDADGWYSKDDGTIQYYSISKQLSNDVKEIIQSFGGVAIQSSKIGKYKLPNGDIKECKECFILTINLPEDIIPFKLDTKIQNMGNNKKSHPMRGIKSIEYSRTTAGQCILVEAEDHLYVMDQYVVTHNTYQSIIAALESGAEKILIVCPSAVKINWEREINNFCDDTVIVSGRKWKRSKFTIINYDILKNFHTLNSGKKNDDGYIVEYNREIVNSKFDLCIIDEAHYLKNHDSIRGKIMQEICVKYGIDKVWLLTGTPIANRPMDFYNLLKLIKAPIADNWKFYVTRYCDAKRFYKKLKNGRKKQIWITDGASNLEELSIKTRNLLLRRKKDEVLDMPEKLVSPNFYELSSRGRKDYENLWDEYLERRKLEKKRGRVEKELVELILLRKFIAMEAIPYTIEEAENTIEEGNKVIIFTTFTDELNELAEHFGDRCVIYNGPMDENAKQYSVDEFQNNDEVKVFIGNIRAAGVGITLTSANYVIFNSFDWVPGNNEQAEDRCIFSGQLVLTDSGYKMIDNIEIGDMVYTHNGNYKKVIDKHTHLENSKLRYDIDVEYFNVLSVTHDHKLYVYDISDNVFKWVMAKDIDILSHYLTINYKNLPHNYTIDINDERIKMVDDYVIHPIKYIHISKSNNERVYDLSVEDDHSFVVGGFNVHNCYRIGQKNNVTVKYQLFLDTISIRIWETLKKKKDIIDTIMNEKNINEIEIQDEIINDIITNDDE